MEALPITYYKAFFTDGKVGLPSLAVTADIYSMTGVKEISDAPVTELGGGVYMWYTTANVPYAVIFKSTINGTPTELLGIREREAVDLTASQVWTNPFRTLIQPGISLETPVTGSELIIYKDATNVISLSDLGDLTNRTQAWFTIKANLDMSDDDAILQVTETGDLQHINQISGVDLGIDKPDVTMAVTDEGQATITISAEAGQALPVMQVTPVEWDFKVAFSDGTVIPIQTGTAYIKQTATRAIS